MKAWLLVFLLIAGLAGCGLVDRRPKPSIYPPESFRESDLIGVWGRDDIDKPHSIGFSEKVIINSDHTFTQTVDISYDSYHFAVSGRWELEKAENGCLYIHLYGMRYYGQNDKFAENGNRGITNEPLLYWDKCGERAVMMPDETILIISFHPSYPTGLVLWYMAIDRETPPDLLQRMLP